MEAPPYKLFPLHLAAMLFCKRDRRQRYCLYASHYELEILSCFPARLRGGHKNFDVYPRDKEKPILSAYLGENKASPFSRPLLLLLLPPICVRDFVSPQRSRRTKSKCADSFADFMRISRNSEQSGLKRSSLTLSLNGQLMREFIAVDTREALGVYKLSSRRHENRRKVFEGDTDRAKSSESMKQIIHSRFSFFFYRRYVSLYRLPFYT